LPERARVIMLGDRDQLASVEAGAVLGDICAVVEHTASDSPIAQCIVQLTRSYRYAAQSGIGELARAVQAGDAERALAVLDDPRFPDVTLHEAKGSLVEPGSPFAQEVVAGYRPYLSAMSDPDPSQALRAFDSFRVLCAHRQGERGGFTRTCLRLTQHIGPRQEDRDGGRLDGRRGFVTHIGERAQYLFG